MKSTVTFENLKCFERKQNHFRLTDLKLGDLFDLEIPVREV